MKRRLEKLVVMVDRADFGETAIELRLEDFQGLRGDAGTGFFQSECGPWGAGLLPEGRLGNDVRSFIGVIYSGIFSHRGMIFVRLCCGERVSLGGRCQAGCLGRPVFAFRRGWD